MTVNVFLDKARAPTPTMVANALGARVTYLHELKRHVQAPLVEEWKYYGKSIGWTLKLLLGKRNLCFVTAADGHFAVSFVLGDKAVEAAKESRLPSDLVQQLVDTKKYVEGRGIRIEVKSRRALEHAKILLDVKQGK